MKAQRQRDGYPAFLMPINELTGKYAYINDRKANLGEGNALLVYKHSDGNIRFYIGFSNV